LLTLGAAAGVFGVEQVLVAAPFVLLIVAAGLVQLSFAFGPEKAPRRFDVFSTFWLESEEPVRSPDDAAASGGAPAAGAEG
ncbi:MAG: hypothetical protein HY874_09195, partial [Chloroflexi bacterium]|nr:hypothetical protein [Chloroflexota bacterium]